MTEMVSDADFEAEVLKADTPVLVDFFAEWCGPCKAMAPALSEFAQDMQGRLKVVKLDVDASPNITNQYQIQAMPTLILIKDGEVAARHTGALVQKSKLEAWVKETVGV